MVKPNFIRDLNILIFSVAAFSGCGFQDSQTKDIFREDQNQARRHPANSDEILWTIRMDGCTGHLLSPDYMMTAAHCSPNLGALYTSGSALKRNAGQDITVAQVVELNSTLDFAILKISWLSGSAPADQKFPPLIATKPTDVNMRLINGTGDELFTVGFPGDQRSATYSQGVVQQTFGSMLSYDMGIINGNSGGGAWLKKNNMLVALTNGGSSSLGQADWNTASVNDPNHWNFGIAMFNAYANSKTLRDIFPDGKNKYGGTMVDGAMTSSLNVALAPLTGGSYKLYVASTSTTTAKVFICFAEAESCNKEANGYRQASFIKTANAVNFYEAMSNMIVKNDTVIGIVSYDQSGKTISKRTVRIRER